MPKNGRKRASNVKVLPKRKKSFKGGNVKVIKAHFRFNGKKRVKVKRHTRRV